jgi:hypothetical protein
MRLARPHVPALRHRHPGTLVACDSQRGRRSSLWPAGSPKPRRSLVFAACSPSSIQKVLAPRLPISRPSCPQRSRRWPSVAAAARLSRRHITDDIESVLLCGLETHVCIQQTALDLLARGLTVFIAVDAVGSRHPIDHEIALRRLEASGVLLTTSEAALFEWCHSAEHPQFQAVRKLVLADRSLGRASSRCRNRRDRRRSSGASLPA